MIYPVGLLSFDWKNDMCNKLIPTGGIKKPTRVQALMDLWRFVNGFKF